MKKVYLVTEDGRAFEGYSFGADVEACGELVFNTGMVGYIEALTDPSYYGQILLETFPLIGNYGIIPNDFQAKPHLCGLVVREWCDTPSNFRCDYDLDKFLKDNGIPGIYGVDTREVTKHLRENGTMNAKICSSSSAALEEIKKYRIENAVSAVTTKTVQAYSTQVEKKYDVVVIDCGLMQSFIDELLARGCDVKVVPADTSAEEILKNAPDGVFISGGPGDPCDNKSLVAEIAKLLGKVAIFGVGLGHQLLALANGASIEKLHHGHRGGNQPSHKVGTNRTYITSQNNGYTVNAESVVRGEISFVNANDNACEGIDYPDQRAFSVQFYPEAIKGMHSTAFLYDKFIEMMEEK